MDTGGDGEPEGSDETDDDSMSEETKIVIISASVAGALVIIVIIAVVLGVSTFLMRRNRNYAAKRLASVLGHASSPVDTPEL